MRGAAEHHETLSDGPLRDGTHGMVLGHCGVRAVYTKRAGDCWVRAVATEPRQDTGGCELLLGLHRMGTEGWSPRWLRKSVHGMGAGGTLGPNKGPADGSGGVFREVVPGGLKEGPRHQKTQDCAFLERPS